MNEPQSGWRITTLSSERKKSYSKWWIKTILDLGQFTQCNEREEPVNWYKETFDGNKKDKRKQA